MEELRQASREQSVLLVATGQLIGEGFDYPRLDMLIMAMPVAWKGVVEQYAGRLNREYEGKETDGGAKEGRLGTEINQMSFNQNW